MIKFLLQRLVFTFGLLLVSGPVLAQTEWTGPTTTFTKAPFADWTLPANQDALTANVILTRANNRGIFNIVSETEYDNITYLSPLDTEWSYGSISDGVGTLTFEPWEAAVGGTPPAMVGQPMVVHLITDDIYIDLTFDSWSQGGASGGGFSYTRSTDNSLSIPSEELNNLSLYPNPARDYIKIGGLREKASYKIFNVLGSTVIEGELRSGESVQLRNLRSGVYLVELTTEQGTVVKRFLKE